MSHRTYDPTKPSRQVVNEVQISLDRLRLPVSVNFRPNGRNVKIDLIPLCCRTVGGFPKSSERIAEVGLDFSSRSDDESCSAHTEPPVNPAGEKTLPASSLCPTSCFEVSQRSADLNACAVFNNYIFHQDPRTGHLSLVPVQVRAPESLLGLDIKLSLVPQPFQELISAPENSEAPIMNCPYVPERPQPHGGVPPSSCFKGSSVTLAGPLEFSAPRAHTGQTKPVTRGDSPSPSAATSPQLHPALKEVIDLLKGEFSLDGFLDSGPEDITMGTYLLHGRPACVFFVPFPSGSRSALKV